MKFNCGVLKKNRIHYLREWHKVFAWFPVKVADNDCRWLETVWRCYPEAFIGPIYGGLNKRNPIYKACVELQGE